MNRDAESLRELKETEARLKELYLASRRGRWTWQAAGALCGLLGGSLAAILGLMLSAWSWMTGRASANDLSLHGAGSLLLLSTIPLLILGGCCLDLLEKRMESRGPVSSAQNIRGVGPGASCAPTDNPRALSLAWRDAFKDAGAAEHLQRADDGHARRGQGVRRVGREL